MSAGYATLRGLDGPEYRGNSAPFSSNHLISGKQAINMIFADGSVRTFSYSLPPATFEALVTVAGGEELPAWE